MPMNRNAVRKLLHGFEFQTLFVEQMGWGAAPRNALPQQMQEDGMTFIRKLIAQQSGVSVFEVYAKDGDALPDAKTRHAIHGQIERLAHENIIIFVDAEAPAKRKQSLWYWVKRDGKKKQPREHLYLKDQPGDLFLSKIDSMVIEMDELREDGTIPITEVTDKLASSLDIERVTKKFYNEFSSLRVEFIDLIEGIDKDKDRFWYASVVLNRLMFIYFLQKRGFIQKNTNYLDEKLLESQRRGTDRYYSEFLNTLFFEGFAKPAEQRSPHARQMLGEIQYLNGGLFIPHKLETDYKTIRIPDRAFENVLALFGKYSWALDDTPGANDDMINPDVLGYIFEKYINQKAFGAYYTRPEITQYLCERTIHAVILDRVQAHSQRTFKDFNEMLVKLDADLCRVLIDAVLPKLSVLDPACGSGAFLVAAMKSLMEIYAAVFGKAEFSNDRNLHERVQDIRKKHPSLKYYIYKRIITDNLYGVDIMEEASEIAKLRLFLMLVSAARNVNELEPLPNIDFNIMTGNSLIGLLTVDEKRFDTKRSDEGLSQLEMFGENNAAKYKELLEAKNALVARYREASGMGDDLHALRQEIDKHKEEAYATLDAILLDDFQALKIQFEQAQVTGKAKKRPLKTDDIRALAPFHWGYEFDEILAAGGFDVIIANPPWEVFQTDEKEFFQQFDSRIAKNKLDIKSWEMQRDKMLKDPEMQSAWLEYVSRYSHVSAYFKNAPQYANQISMVDGRIVSRKINLYALFVEQCINLLRKEGLCGIVIPSGIYTDLGTKQLREMLFSSTEIQALFGLSNEKFIFEGVHHAFKFVLLTFMRGTQTENFRAAFRINPREAIQGEDLDTFLNTDSEHIWMNVPFVRRLSPDSLSVPEYKSVMDVQIADKLSVFPLLGDELPDSWNIRFRQELNMTSDSDLFHTAPAVGRLPLYEGKMIHQFTHLWGEPKYWLNENEARARIIGKRDIDNGQTLDYQMYRLGFRDVAASTNERTMIMTMLPVNVFCNHKIPTGVVKLGRRVDYHSELIACVFINSYIIDYILRMRVTTNLTFFFLYQLPVPRLKKGDTYFDALVERAAKLICTTTEFDDLAREVGLGSHAHGVTDAVERARLRAEIDAMVAHIYGLTEEEFVHVLASFPLVSEGVKVGVMSAYGGIG